MVQRTPVCALPSMYSGGEFLRGAGRALAHYYAASKMRQRWFTLAHISHTSTFSFIFFVLHSPLTVSPPAHSLKDQAADATRVQ